MRHRIAWAPAMRAACRRKALVSAETITAKNADQEERRRRSNALLDRWKEEVARRSCYCSDDGANGDDDGSVSRDGI